jgi:hypothetical protein
MNLDGAPHPYRDQVHIHLAHFRPRARSPRMCLGESGFLAADTISIDFGSAMGLARETLRIIAWRIAIAGFQGTRTHDVGNPV